MVEPVRFLREHILSGIVTDLTLEDWSYSATLCRPGALRAKVPLTSPDATETALAPYATALYAVRGMEVEWGGILDPPQLSLGDSALSINATGWLGYWDRRIIRSSYLALDTDQFTIVADLIANAQDEATFGTGYDLGITVDYDALSGRRRDRAYADYEAKNLGEVLRQLAAVRNGFDISMNFTLNAATDRIDKTVRLDYPRKGRDTGFVFEYQRDAATNVLSRGFADPVTFAWAGDGWGSGNDATRLRSRASYEPARGYYPPYDAAPTWSTVTEQTTLDEHTVGAFMRSGRPQRIPVLRVDPNRYPKWGDYEEGDIVSVAIDDGYGSTANAAPEPYRITGWSVTNDETFDLVFADPLGQMAEDDITLTKADLP